MIAACLALTLLAPATQSADELWARGQRLGAIALMATQLERRGDDAQLRLALVRRELALHRYAAALGHLDRLGAEADAERGYCLFRLGRLAEALTYLDPCHADHAFLIFDTLEALGRHADAARALARAALVHGAHDPRVLARRGKTLAREGEHARAAEVFRAALAADPILLEALFGLGRALIHAGEREEGLAMLARHRALVPLMDELDFARKSLDLDPRRAPNRARVGDAERKLGLLERAEASYRDATALATPAELTPIALRHARLVEEDRGDPKAAIRLLQAAFVRVRDARLPVRAGALSLKAGDPRSAVAWLEKARALRPDDAEIRRRLGQARAAAEARR